MGKYRQVLDILGESKWLVVPFLFAFCVAPTFISYKPYVFKWDDSDYLQRSIAVSQAFWSGNVHGLGSAMVSIRPPAMTLLGLPWGPLASWDAACKCFVTLAAAISLLAALCLYLLLRIGVKPLFLALASVCVFASIGPYPPGATAHLHATAFEADSLFAWTTLAALLLIPYEARTPCPAIRCAVVRGILWGSVLSLGAMTKINFLYFVVLILPTLFLLRLHHDGLRRALAALAAFACWSAPSAIYLVRWGGRAFDNAKSSSFGRAAEFYYVPLLKFLAYNISQSPGFVLFIVLMATALAYLAIKKRLTMFRPDVLAFLFIAGFCIIALAAPNRQIRYIFPAIVALPFLTGILMSDKGYSIPGRSAALAAGLVFCGLLAVGVPTRSRANRQSLSRSEAVLAHAVGCNANRIVLATASETLNQSLMEIAIAVSPFAASVNVDNLAYRATAGVPIEEDFRTISESDQVVFQDRDALDPPFLNLRDFEYERYVRQSGYAPVRVGDDLSVYSERCHSRPN